MILFKEEKIIFKYMSYRKINFFKKNISQNHENLFIFLYILNKNKMLLNIKFNIGRSYTKVFCLVKGPKCHKTGKHIIKYNFYSYYMIINQKIKFNKNINLLFKYLVFLKDSLKMYDSNYFANNKIILNTYTNIF